MTPYELDLLVQAQRRKQRRETLPIAMLIQMTANIHRDEKVRPAAFGLDEVLSWLGYPPEAEPQTPPPAPPTVQELREKLQQAAALFPRQNGQEG